MGILPFLAIKNMVRKGYVYTIAVLFLCVTACIQQQIALHLAAFYLAFSSKTHCIQQQNTLHLAAKRSAFSTKTHCVQRHIALNLATNSPKTGANGGFIKLKFISHIHLLPPFLHQNQPSRESIFCGKVSDWLPERALTMLNFAPKTRQKRFYCLHEHGKQHAKHVR